MGLRAWIVVSSAIIGVASFASGAVHSYDGFADLTSGVGWTGSWVKLGTVTRSTTSLAGAQLPATAGAVSIATSSSSSSAAAVRRPFDLAGAYSDIAAAPDYTYLGTPDTSLWVSWLMQVPAAANSGSQTYDFELSDTHDAYSPVLSVGRTTSGFGLSFNGTFVTSATGYTPDASAHLFVLQVQFTSTDATTRLYIDPAGQNWLATPNVSYLSAGRLYFDGVRAMYNPRMRNSQAMLVDEVYVGDTAADVSLVPEPGIVMSSLVVAASALARRPTRPAADK